MSELAQDKPEARRIRVSSDPDTGKGGCNGIRSVFAAGGDPWYQGKTEEVVPRLGSPHGSGIRRE